jgi:signal transduction histidine kinase
MATDEALLAARMRALAAFAPGYFHDLKGPLNTIVLRLELLRAVPSGEAADEKRRASVTAIEEQVRRLDRLLQGWLAYTAPIERARPACDLRALMQDLVALAAPSARKRHIELAAALPETALAVRGAEAALSVALLDLLQHALARIEAGSTLALELGTRDGQARLELRGVALDAAALALAAGIVGAAGGSCAPDAGDGSAAGVVLTLPLAAA